MAKLKLTIELECPEELDAEEAGQTQPEITRVIVAQLYEASPDSLPDAKYTWKWS